MSRMYMDTMDYCYPIPLYRDMYYNSLIVLLPQTTASKQLMRRCGDYLGSQWNMRQEELAKKDYKYKVEEEDVEQPNK